MSDEISRFVDQQLPNTLNPIRHVRNPEVFYFKVELVAPLSEGNISVVPSGQTVMPWLAAERMAQDLHRLGIRVEFDFESSSIDRTQDLKFTLQSTNKFTHTYRFVAPWYVELYCNSPNIDSEAGQILGYLNHITEKAQGRYIYRGESNLYPRMTSTLSRHWVTDSPHALRVIGQNNLSSARQFLQGTQPEDLDLTALIQHMGGVTNLVDFSTEIWVALFFACMDHRTPPKHSNTGRVWLLDRNREYEDLEVHSLENMTSPVQQDRWERQAGVVVIPRTGTVLQSHLKEAARISSNHKQALNHFLDQIGISIRTLFNDLEGYIRYEQDYIPVEAISHMTVRLLETGEYDRAFQLAESTSRLDDEMNQELGCYLRSLCNAFEGRLIQANRDIEDFIKRRRNVPRFVESNRRLLRNKLRNNRGSDYGRNQKRQLRELQKQISLDLDKDLWSITLEGYTFVER